MTGAPDPWAQGREALAKIDVILAKRPHKDDYMISDATQALCDFREGLIAEGPPARDRLERLNGVLAMLLGVHFPLSDTPWDGLTQARGWLYDLVDG